MGRRKYTIDENYFDVIDTEEKAYWIGFIWCDGSVSSPRKGRKNPEHSFRLSINYDDETHLTKFLNSLNSDNKIQRVKYNNKAFKAKNPYYSQVKINNAKFCEKLYYGYGLIPHRVNADKLIDEIPFELIKHFIRGVIDADGSIVLSKCENHSKRFKPAIQISTYSEINRFINDYLIQVGLMKNKLKFYKRHEDRDYDCRRLTIGGWGQVYSILNHLYNSANIYLDRKYDKSVEVMEVGENRMEA